MNRIKSEAQYTLKEFLEFNVASLGKHQISVYEIIGAILALIMGFIVSLILKRLVYKTNKIDEGKKFAISQIFHYIIVVIAIFFALKSLGVNISPLLLGSGAILVGIGLGLQNLFLDFISGIIILLDRSIKVGDIVEFDGNVGKVMEIRMRTTTVLTRDDKSMIFPNSFLTKEKLVNYSHYNSVVAFSITVGVHYDTNLDKAFELLKEAAMEDENVLRDHPLMARLENFGESSLDLKLIFYSDNLFRSTQILADIRKKILEKFRKEGIIIPYPMRTLDLPKELFINPNKE